MSADVIVLCPPGSPDELVYPNHVRFYEDLLSLIFPQDPDPAGPCWCPQWRDHPAAEYAVASLWRAWDHLQRDPGPGQASWLANLALPIMRELTAEGGPFQGCTPDEHSPAYEPLPRMGGS